MDFYVYPVQRPRVCEETIPLQQSELILCQYHIVMHDIYESDIHYHILSEAYRHHSLWT